MKKLITFLVLILGLMVTSSLNSAETAEKIHWQDFNTGYAEANATGKIAVIDCYTNWCYWCKVMDKKTFADSSVISKMNDNFIPIKFNPEDTSKRYYIGGDTLYGKQLEYALSNKKSTGYPTIFFYVPQTKRMFSQPGYHDVKSFHEILDRLIDYQNKIKSR